MIFWLKTALTTTMSALTRFATPILVVGVLSAAGLIAFLAHQNTALRQSSAHDRARVANLSAQLSAERDAVTDVEARTNAANKTRATQSATLRDYRASPAARANPATAPDAAAPPIINQALELMRTRADSDDNGGNNE